MTCSRFSIWSDALRYTQQDKTSRRMPRPVSYMLTITCGESMLPLASAMDWCVSVCLIRCVNSICFDAEMQMRAGNVRTSATPKPPPIRNSRICLSPILGESETMARPACLFSMTLLLGLLVGAWRNADAPSSYMWVVCIVLCERRRGDEEQLRQLVRKASTHFGLILYTCLHFEQTKH